MYQRYGSLQQQLGQVGVKRDKILSNSSTTNRDNLVFPLGELLVQEPLVLNVSEENVIHAVMRSGWTTK